MKDWTPRPYQGLMFEFLHKVARCCLFVPMGFGKTSAVLWALLAFLLAGRSRRVLVLAPLRVARSTWPDEVRQWSIFNSIRITFIGEWLPEELAFLRARALLMKLIKTDESCAAPATRLAMAEVDRLHPLAQTARLQFIRRYDVITCNYDVLQQIVDILADKWPFDTVVCDESTRLKSTRTKQGSKRGRALADVAFLPRVKRWINLSGTPVPNGLQDLWGQMYFIDQGSRLGRSYSAFENRFFGIVRQKNADKANRFNTKRVLFPHAEAEINKIISKVCFTLNVKDWFDIDEPIVNKIYIDLPPEARQQYAQLERELFTDIDGHRIEAFAMGAKFEKCHQLASGAVYVNGSNKEWADAHDEKIEALRSIVEEAAGAPVLVAYHHRSDAVRIERAFPDARRLDADPRTIKDWNEGRIPLLLAHPASAGHGLSLQHGGNILVYFCTWWSLENNQQILERIGPVRQKQSGYDRPVFVHYIIARRTVDEMVMKRTETKASVQQVFLDALQDFNRSETHEPETIE